MHPVGHHPHRATASTDTWACNLQHVACIRCCNYWLGFSVIHQLPWQIHLPSLCL